MSTRIDPYISLHFQNLTTGGGEEDFVATMARKKARIGATEMETAEVPEEATRSVKASPVQSRAILESGQVQSLQATRRRPQIPVLIQFKTSGWNRDIAGLEKGSWLGRILTAFATQEAIGALQADPDVIAIEASRQGGIMECARSMSWINVPAVHMPPLSQKGRGAIVAVVDDGIDVLHHAFRDGAGQSRILWVWDQRDGTGPTPATVNPTVFQENYGTLHSQAAINGYIAASAVGMALGRDALVGHGTHVASIAAGSPLPGVNFPGGVAPEAAIIVVIPKLSAAPGNPVSLGYSKSHADALAFVREAADDEGMPVAVNVSLGMNAGAHDGTSLLELAFDNFSGGGRDPGYVVVKSAGNEFGHSGHAYVQAFEGGVIPIEWETSNAPRLEDYIEFWFASCDDLRFTLVAPNGSRCSVDRQTPAAQSFYPNGMVSCYMTLTRFHPDNGDSRLLVVIRNDQGGPLVVDGIWRLDILGNAVFSEGIVHGWVERDNARAVTFGTGSTNELTLSIPATARTVIAVGACSSTSPLTLSLSSSRGPTRDLRSKPELVAPGVNVVAADSNTSTGLVSMTGTSMAAPHVTGAVALLLAQRVASGQPQLNAAQVKAALSQCLKSFNGRWQSGFGNGGLDVQALLDAFA